MGGAEDASPVLFASDVVWRCAMAESQQNGLEGEAKQQAAGLKGEHPLGKGEGKISSDVPERAAGQINPSSPADTATTPGSVAEIG